MSPEALCREVYGFFRLSWRETERGREKGWVWENGDCYTGREEVGAW